MNFIHRNSYQKLREWKTSDSRKPLLLRGARQVGKTTLVRSFAQEFEQFIELNLEKESEKELFEIDDLEKLINAIFLLKKVRKEGAITLLFIDEIQENPKAIKMLRYFYEEAPWLYVIAAGSLLEFSLKKVSSFPVGRVDYLYIHPINFPEFLRATHNEQALELLQKAPIEDYAHSILLDQFNTYCTVGGMPEIVLKYVTSKTVAPLATRYQKLWQAYKDDVEKYAQNETQKNVMRHVIQAAPHQQDRIKFEGFGNSTYRSREVSEAIRALDLANVVRLVYPTTSTKAPVITDYKKRPRLQLLDTGLLNQALNIQSELIPLSEFDDFHNGRIIQHIVYQELISIHEDTRYTPHFWVRQEKDSNSEVDLVFLHKNILFPIEIKSGSSGTLRSLHQFVERSSHKFAIRLYSGHFNIEETQTSSGVPYLLMNVPYYLTTQLPMYLDYFLEQHS